ncbi:MAG: hypothetical protein WCI89_03075 [bacterium]
MNTLNTAAVVLTLTTVGMVLMFLLLITVFLGFITLACYWFWFLWNKKDAGKQGLLLLRMHENPLLGPNPEQWWESEAVFNPAAFVHGGRVHLLYRAMGRDGVSRVGYASSPDGIHFDERLPHPVYDRGAGFDPAQRPYTRTYSPLSYDTQTYASGGGWGGCEDPRAVVMNDHVYMSFGIFENWESMRLAVTTLHCGDLQNRAWKWSRHIPMSAKNQTHKNWMLFPEKIDGKFAILHALTPGVSIEYINALEDLHENPIQSNNQRAGRPGHWDAFVRGAAAPPIKTEKGWLLLYHGMDPTHPAVGYRVGAMLLDLTDPTKILYRSTYPILEPTEWYENDWKPGVVYASGAVVFGDDLLVYYGGGDKHIAAARTNLNDFIDSLTHHTHATLKAV